MTEDERNEQLENDDDLLKILQGSSDDNNDNDKEQGNKNQSDTKQEKNPIEEAMNQDEEDIDKKMEQIKSLADSLKDGSSNTGSNPGSGDIDVDISNWYKGKDVVPSDELNTYTANAPIKMSYGLSRHTLNNYEMMGKLGKFINSSFDMLFSEQALMTLDPDDIADRMKIAFTMYKELGSLSQKTYHDLIEQRNRWNEDDGDIDKLAMLLASIPSEKLQNVLEEISFKDKRLKPGK